MNNPSQLVTLRQNKQRLPVVVAITGLTEKLRTQVLIVSRPGLRDKMQQIGIIVVAVKRIITGQLCAYIAGQRNVLNHNSLVALNHNSTQIGQCVCCRKDNGKRKRTGYLLRYAE